MNTKPNSNPVPKWLKNLKSLDKLSFKRILHESLFYPASGIDGKPVKWTRYTKCYSFVYSDYGITEKYFRTQLTSIKGFKGYKIFRQRKIECNELYPKGRILPFLHEGDGDPWKNQENVKVFFSIWTILERSSGLDDNHGPQRLSLLFVCDEAVTVLRNLYRRHNCFPESLAIIMPGGWGGNWTNFYDSNSALAREVINNPSGKPSYLISDAVGDGLSGWPNEIMQIPLDLNY